MGYASPAPKNAGIHTRLFSRAFVIEDETNRIVFVSVDCGMIDQIVKTEASPFFFRTSLRELWLDLTVRKDDSSLSRPA